MPNEPKYRTVKEAADELHRSVCYVYDLIDRGKLAALVDGRSKMVVTESLRRFQSTHIQSERDVLSSPVTQKRSTNQSPS